MQNEIANTILQQLGGANPVAVMTGARFVSLKNGVCLNLSRGGKLTIALNSADLYDVTGDAWSEPVVWLNEAEAFRTFEAFKAESLVDAVAVLSRPSANKPWQVCANARKKFGYLS